MTTNTQAISHILHRVIPFESETFRFREQTLLPGHTLALNNYFQVLHLEPLSTTGEAEPVELSLSVRGQGKARVSIYHIWNAGQTTKQISTDCLFQDCESQISFSVAQIDLRGVIYAEIESSESELSILEVSWAVTRAPKQISNPRLAIVSCTFNRHADIVRTIATIQKSSGFKNGLIDVFVVDNGNNLQLPDELEHDRVRLFGQRNLGGAGGFTRGIIEATKLESMTHVLLMDDDVEISHEVIDRLLAWFAILPPDVAVSGAMLDGFQKTVLYEAGARFLTHTFEIKPDFNNIELSHHSTALDKLSRPSDTDYGAWWFFAFPRSVLKKSGLPLPVFIRGDDIEFGVRLKKLGYRTQVIHGLAVWHEPFYLKRSVWPMYYAVRNLTLLNGVHFNTPPKTYILSIAKMFFQFIFRYDYGVAAALERGLSDFLMGPSHLTRPGDENHFAVTAYLAQFQPKFVNSADVADLRMETSPRKSIISTFLRAITISGHLLPAHAAAPQLFDDSYVSWRWLRADSYIQFNLASQSGQLFSKDPRKFWILLKKMFITLLWACFVYRKRCEEYRNGFDSLTSEDSWRAYLGMPKAGQA